MVVVPLLRLVTLVLPEYFDLEYPYSIYALPALVLETDTENELDPTRINFVDTVDALKALSTSGMLMREARDILRAVLREIFLDFVIFGYIPLVDSFHQG